MAVVNSLRVVLYRSLLLAVIWWVLTQGATNSWLVGVPVVLLATALSVYLLPAMPLSLSGTASFIVFFLCQSIRSGVIVSRCALDPKLPISPLIYDYPLRLPPGLPRVLLVNVVNLLPGTLSVDLGEHSLSIHVLDKTSPFIDELKVLENRLAGALGIKLTETCNG